MNEPKEDPIGAKAISKAVEKTIDGVGSFFSALCIPATEEFGLLLRDKVTAYRLENLEKISLKAKKLIEQRNITATGNTSPKVLTELLEESSWADDAQVQSMWAGLIAVSASNTKNSDDSLVYIDIIKKLTPFQARVVNLIYKDPRCCSVADAGQNAMSSFFSPKNQLVYTVPEVIEQYPGDLSEIVPIAHTTHTEIISNRDNYGIAIGRFKPQLDSLVSLDLLESVEYHFDDYQGLRFLPSYRGLDFYMRCLGYSVYPIEAFLLTLQHWCSLKDIDPFTYMPTRTQHTNREECS